MLIVWLWQWNVDDNDGRKFFTNCIFGRIFDGESGMLGDERLFLELVDVTDDVTPGVLDDEDDDLLLDWWRNKSCLPSSSHHTDREPAKIIVQDVIYCLIIYSRAED